MLVALGAWCFGGQAAADYREMTSHSSHHDRAAAARSRCNPLTWPELQTIISTGDLHKLVRSEEQEQTYFRARSKVRFMCSCVYCAAAVLLRL